VAIHPFADGNGRLARAIASIFTLRAESIPVMVLFDTRAEYYAALQQADQKNYQPFTNFIFERSLEGVQLASESFEAAKGDLEKSLNRIKTVYTTKGGYTQEEVDRTGYQFSGLFKTEIELQLMLVRQENCKFQIGPTPNRTNTDLPGFRNLGSSLVFTASSNQPYELSDYTILSLFVPVNSDIDGSIFFVNSNDINEKYECRISEIIPNLKSALRIRVSIMVERFLNKRLAEFADLLEQAKNNG
jgi:hypothetical protein